VIMTDERKACKFCSMLVMKDKEVCPTHSVVECCGCGRGALWMARQGAYVCMNLDCDWRSSELPRYGGFDLFTEP
jgi:hypothetical protein